MWFSSTPASIFEVVSNFCFIKQNEWKNGFWHLRRSKPSHYRIAAAKKEKIKFRGFWEWKYNCAHANVAWIRSKFVEKLKWRPYWEIKSSVPSFLKKSGRQRYFLLGLYWAKLNVLWILFINMTYTVKCYDCYFTLGEYFAEYWDIRS